MLESFKMVDRTTTVGRQPVIYMCTNQVKVDGVFDAPPDEVGMNNETALIEVSIYFVISCHYTNKTFVYQHKTFMLSRTRE